MSALGKQYDRATAHYESQEDTSGFDDRNEQTAEEFQSELDYNRELAIDREVEALMERKKEL